MSQPMNTAILEKLQKIQAIIDDSKNDHEAEVGMLLFQRLLEKHHLTSADVLEQNVEEPHVHSCSAILAARIPDWQKLLHVYIAKHFRCVTINYTRRSYAGDTYERVFIGIGNDPEIAVATYHAAVQVAISSWERYSSRQKGSNPSARLTTGHRTQFCQSFAEGLNRAYHEQEDKLQLGLILVRDPRVDEAVRGCTRSTLQIVHRADEYGSRTEGFRAGHEYGRGNSLPESSQM